jgi:hypothetical protein
MEMHRVRITGSAETFGEQLGDNLASSVSQCTAITSVLKKIAHGWAHLLDASIRILNFELLRGGELRF